MTLQNRLEKIGIALAELTPETYHYWRARPKGVNQYVIWAEDMEDSSFTADNHKQRQGIHGTVDLFTKAEFDPLADRIQACLDGIENLTWRLSSIQFEEDTALIHHEWEWWLR